MAYKANRNFFGNVGKIHGVKLGEFKEQHLGFVLPLTAMKPDRNFQLSGTHRML
jgi:hypothetical protein